MTGAISQDRESCQFLFCLIKNPLLYRAARPESGREVREVCLITPLARTQSERCRRLALATGFRLLRLYGIDRIAAQGSVAGRGWAGPDRRVPGPIGTMAYGMLGVLVDSMPARGLPSYP